jgi:hypothetical protein
LLQENGLPHLSPSFSQRCSQGYFEYENIDTDKGIARSDAALQNPIRFPSKEKFTTLGDYDYVVLTRPKPNA